jgi:hypothetical protein
VIIAGACGEPTATSGSSAFSAQVLGTSTHRLSGSATASFGGDWARENALQVTLPNGATFSGVALVATNGTVISLFRPGTELPVGTFAMGRVGGELAFPKGGFSGGYVVRRSDGLQLFIADSGHVTITQTGMRVTGLFTLHAKHYDVLPIPTRESSGKPITPISSGESEVTISGVFDAVRR